MAGKWHFPFKHASNNSEPALDNESEAVNQNISDLAIHDEEHIRYALELESILSGLEEGMHTSDNPREIVLAAMKTACDFYEADWCGFLEVDLDLSLWAPLIWYNPSLQDRTLDILNDFESAEFFPRWIKCMKTYLCIFRILMNYRTQLKASSGYAKVYLSNPCWLFLYFRVPAVFL